MSSNLLEIEFNFPDWAELLKSKKKELDLFIAANIQLNRGMLFDNEGAWNGRSRWKDLVFRNGQILSKRGALRKSIAPFNPNGTPGPDGIVKMSGDTITIGTTVMYARMMNYGTASLPGGVLRPKNAKALKIPLPSGKSATPASKSLRKGAAKGNNNEKFIFRKSVKIPARSFIDWNEQDQKELDAALLSKISEILAKGR